MIRKYFFLVKRSFFNVLKQKFRLIITVLTLGLSNLFFTNDLFADIVQRGSATTGQISGNSITIAKPTGIVAGDVMIANIIQHVGFWDLDIDASLTGWTEIDGRMFTWGLGSYWKIRGTLLYRIADGTEGSSFTFSLDGDASGGVGGIVAFSGVDVTGGYNAGGTANSGPFDVDPGSYSNYAYDAQLNAPAITTNTANAAVIMFGIVGYARSFSNWATTSPGTLTELYGATNGNNEGTSVGAAWAIKPTTGSTGTGTASLNNNGRNASMMVALKAAVCSNPPTAEAGQNITTCTGTSAIAMTGATASGSYSGTPTWSGGGGTWVQNSNPASATFTPSAASGSFTATLTLTGAGVCPNATDTRTITWGTQPVAEAGNNITTCTGTSAITMTGASASGTYSGTPTWSGSGGTWVQNANPSLATFTPGSASGSITATLTLTGTNGCSNSTDTRTITWGTQPLSGTLTPTPAAGGVCDGSNVSAVATAGTGGVGTIADVLEYRFDGGTWTAYASGTNLNTTGHTSIDIQTYRTATGSGCTSSIPVMVSWTVNPLPTFTYSKSDITCFGAGNGFITINASNGTSPYFYRYSTNGGSNWIGGDAEGWIQFVTGTTQVISPPGPGDYTIQIKDSNGCAQINCTPAP